MVDWGDFHARTTKFFQSWIGDKTGPEVWDGETPIMADILVLKVSSSYEAQGGPY